MQVKELSTKYAGLAQRVEQHCGDSVMRVPSRSGELSYTVGPDALLETCTILRDDDQLRFQMLMDVCGVDYLAYGRDEWHTIEATGMGFSRGVARDSHGFAADARGEGVEFEPPSRFAVVYHLLSIENNARLRLKVFCASDERPMVESVREIWASADWYEREAFDLYGILFRGHPDLRRILTDYGFIGHPFRKDFPLVGNVEMRYDPEKGRVVYEPVSIEPRTLVPKVIRDDARYEAGLKDPDNA
jgi:NADH-quinone oxidoreductase subunit C